MLAGVLTALVGLAFGGLFAGGPAGRAALELVAAAACAAALGCLAGARLRPAPLVGLAGLAGALAFSVLVLFAGRLTDGASVVTDFGAAARDGWARLLTVGLPAAPDGDLLLLPVLLVWLAAFSAAVLVVRAEAVLAPLLPPLLGYIVALLLVASRGRSLFVLTGLIAVVGLALAVVRAAQLPGRGRIAAVAVGLTEDGTGGPGAPGGAGASGEADQAGSDASGPTSRPGRGRSPSGLRSRSLAGAPSWRRPRAGQLAVGIPAVALMAALGTGLAVLSPIAEGNDRFDPRDHRHPPVDITSTLNPLVQVKSARGGAERKLFTVRLPSNDGKVVTDRIRTAVLTDFDGATWRDDSVFVRTGSVLGTDDTPVTTTGREIQMDVTAQAPGGPFLPTLGQPTGIRDATVSYAYQPSSGSLAATDPLRAGDRYVLTAQVPVADDPRLPDAHVARGTEILPYLALPANIPEEITYAAADAVGTETTAFGKITSLTAYLNNSTMFPVDLDARPGHSLGALKRFLDPGGVKADHHGYVEQFVTAFVLLARIESLPSRIAVGYLLDGRTSSQAGEFTVTSRQAFAWPEVALEGIGWVAFDPTDISKLKDRLPPPDPDDPTGGDGAAQAPEAQAADAVVRPELDRSADLGATGGGSGASSLWWVLLLVLLVVAVAVPAGIVGEKARRRRRRARAGPPAARVAGAWREVRDRLAERGLARSLSLSADQVADLAAARRGPLVGDQLALLAPLVGTALFGATEPDDTDARRAWELTAAASRELRRSDGVRRRVTATLSPVPLLPRRRR
ncbi:transglutaminase [Frankia sp. CcI49]|uniref:transglutaminase family protein n=1 Tax=Frankia sp. CcI49 TaxID=1745382 RepID=UPI0009772717|nr:transglutaminase domain-containing protein [Frankia sp. CcI49]ONH57004.1 transglutaminase [Frankia sp. CcI49]